MRVNRKGQVTIPAAIRVTTGLLPNTEVELFQEGDSVRIVPANSKAKKITRREQVIRRLRGSAGTVGMTTDEIMALTRSEK